LPDHLRIQPKSSSQSKLEISFSDLPKWKCKPNVKPFWE
jgi:hypothetical protein